MYGLPEDFPYDLLVGKTLTQMCSGLHECIFNFTDQVSVRVSSSIALGDGHPTEDFPSMPGLARGLLAEQVVQASPVEGKHLRLEFSNGLVLTIIDEDQPFESYAVEIGERYWAI